MAMHRPTHSPALPASLIAALLLHAACIDAGQDAEAVEEARVDGLVELAPARPAGPRETTWLRLRVGGLPRTAEIRVNTPEGALLGTLSRHGASYGAPQAATTHLLPLPEDALASGRVRLRLTVDTPGMPARAPRPGEVEAVELIHVPVDP